MKNTKEHHPKIHKQISPEQIIECCRQKFINILPNTLTRQPGVRSIVNSQNLSPINIVYRREEIKQVIRQLSIFLQLTIQNYVLSSDQKVRRLCLQLLGRFRDYLARDLQYFENVLTNKTKGRLPDYEVDCKAFTRKDIVLRIPPQISLYQDPLLFYIYSRIAQEQLFCNHSIMMTREERIQILRNHIPFLNPLFIPLVGERLETKAKFSQLQDRLLQMIISSPRKDIAKLKMIYFSNRPQQQIKNRIKNLCGNAKDISNPIKQMKMNEYVPLREQQIQILQEAYGRFGPRWPVISKYYQMRTPQFLQAEYSSCERLARKRSKQNVAPSYQGLKQLLQQRGKKKGQVQQMQMQQIIQQVQSSRALQQSIQPEELEPVYKIINNMTFLVEEI